MINNPIKMDNPFFQCTADTLKECGEIKVRDGIASTVSLAFGSSRYVVIDGVDSIEENFNFEELDYESIWLDTTDESAVIFDDVKTVVEFIKQWILHGSCELVGLLQALAQEKTEPTVSFEQEYPNGFVSCEQCKYLRPDGSCSSGIECENSIV